MTLTKSQKEEQVEQAYQRMTTSHIAICADYRGLTVAQFTELRRKLRSAGFQGRVYKNTLARIAAKKAMSDSSPADLEKFAEIFTGPSFVLFSENDPVSPAKIAADFAKEHEVFSIKGAWFDNAFIDAEGVKQLATMPSKEETLAKLLALLNTPATRMLQMMNAPAAQLVRLLAAYRDKLKEEGK